MLRKVCLTFLILVGASGATAQDAKSFALAGCGTATMNDAFSVYWNPAALAVREKHVTGAAISGGFSAWDTSNLEIPVLDVNGRKAAESGADPYRRATLYQGLFAVQHRNYGGGVYYEDSSREQSNASALDFLEARRTLSFPSGATYTPERTTGRTRAQHLVVGTGQNIPVGGAIPFLGVGASLKYTLGSLREETAMGGYFVHGVSDGLAHTRFRSERGKGISYDAGVLAKLASGFMAGCVWENVKSKVTWEGVAETLAHDVSTGAETTVASRDEEREVALPRSIRIGLVLMPEGKDIQIIGESRRLDRKTRWRFAVERLYPQQKITVRAGILKDPATDKTDVTLGGGWFMKSLDVNAGILFRKFPAVLDSQSIGGALSASYIF